MSSGTLNLHRGPSCTAGATRNLLCRYPARAGRSCEPGAAAKSGPGLWSTKWPDISHAARSREHARDTSAHPWPV